MSHTKILTYFIDAVNYVSEHIADYAYQPGRDFTRKNKLPPEKRSHVTFDIPYSYLDDEDEDDDVF